MSETDLSRFEFPEWKNPPQRVVSLVPSITESIFELGFGETVIGITDYCTHPADRLRHLIRVGGPKKPSLGVIDELRPDLVIANQEETSRESIEALSGMGYPVWLIFPKNVDDSMNLLRRLLALFHSDKYVQKIESLQKGVDYARLAGAAEIPVSYFCPIWYEFEDNLDWWMTFNQDTYPSDLLSLFGGSNVFASRERLYPKSADLGQAPAEPPGGRDTRYPRVTAAEVIAAQPEIIFLPNEPYSFSEKDQRVIQYAFADTPAVRKGRVYLIEGSLLTWYGVRLAKALGVFPDYFLPG